MTLVEIFVTTEVRNKGLEDLNKPYFVHTVLQSFGMSTKATHQSQLLVISKCDVDRIFQ